ncbi:snRNA-activating protein complex subunit 4 [Penaeus vannamei]|uniref:snRNA-activating protein complex subunit 4 n=1 Tax=Penaeus vannamei TaxID=6689 RepID=A0A3R7MMH5_PENVA|nr:snRNA-activating protein complex subunit 4 [Penaeus vannamei]
MEVDDSDYENELGPVPESELQKQVDVAKIVDRAFEHVKHNQAAEEVADIIAGTEGLCSLEGVAVQDPLPPEIQARNFRVSHTSSGVGSDGTGSRSIHLRYSGTASFEVQNFAASGETVDDLLNASPSLETLHKLNSTLQKRFEEKLVKLERILQTNLARQAQLKDEISQDKANLEQEKKGDAREKAPFRVSNFCVPYFKNRSGMNAPKNEDAKFKLDNGCLDLYTTRARQWKAKEKEALKESVHKEWKQQLIGSKELKLRELQRKLRNAADPNSAETILEEMTEDLERQIRNLQSTPAESLTPPPHAKMDWEKIAAQAFDGHRTSDECSLQWENLLHPSINTSDWDPKEDMIIQELVTSSKHDVPDWNKIASKLMTQRTGYLFRTLVSFLMKWKAGKCTAVMPPTSRTERKTMLGHTCSLPSFTEGYGKSSL